VEHSARYRKIAQSERTVAEEVAAAKMMFLAKKRGSVPKDLGIDLLILKDKQVHEEPYDQEMEIGTKIIDASENSEPVLLDPAGMFKISIDRTLGLLVAMHFSPSNSSKPNKIVKGRTAESVYTKITELGLVSTLDHAAYVGSELSKGEIALLTGKEYVQDNALFKK
jgi:dihydropteroate synthase-like protein